MITGKRKEKKMDDYAIVLDFSRVGDKYKCQVVGTKYFALLEILCRQPVSLQEKVYIGKGIRDKVEKILRKIRYSELTSIAKDELENAILSIITERESEFVELFNKAGPISVRRHSLELLPGIGKKHLQDILKEREKKPFSSLEEIKKRVKQMPNPAISLAKRILDEISGECEDKYRLFVR